MTTPYGFRIMGACTGERRLVDWQAVFAAYATLDARIDATQEAYLSAFTFGADFRSYLKNKGSTKGFAGACGLAYLWLDIDREELEAARLDAARLASFIVDRFGLDDDGLLVFFSGSKGFHLGLPANLWEPTASPVLHETAKKLAEGLAAAARVVIDSGVYDRVRAFRAPNSRHSKTGLFKRALSLEELTRLSMPGIQQLAREPMPFELPITSARSDQAVKDWQEASRVVETTTEATRQKRRAGNGSANEKRGAGYGSAKLNRSFFEFLAKGAAVGDRHRALFSAAANLAEFATVAELAHALLTEAALDSGLSPSEARRQIDCGLNHSQKQE